METYHDAIAATYTLTDDLDAHGRKEIYWALICRLAKTDPEAVIDAVDHLKEGK
jgi:hypothetical protein